MSLHLQMRNCREVGSPLQHTAPQLWELQLLVAVAQSMKVAAHSYPSQNDVKNYVCRAMCRECKYIMSNSTSQCSVTSHFLLFAAGPLPAHLAAEAAQRPSPIHKGAKQGNSN